LAWDPHEVYASSRTIEKGTSMSIITRVSAGLILALCLTSRVVAATAVDTVRVDLNPLIDSAARSQVQFAVNIRRAVSSASQGTWKQKGALSTWVYTVQIPTAISVSFHASAATLPPSAVLTVSTDHRAVNYLARNVNRGGLWGRPLPGDTVTFSLSVASSEAGRVQFQIESFQAGYRSLVDGMPDHPHYAELKRAAASAASCTENYSCHVTTGNKGPSQATVALLIGNLYQCTGTLVNNTASDGRPYVLTARHCENGQLGGGDPDAAATVSVYWDALTPCGTPLFSLYDEITPSQSGATTALEQQDLWLIQLDAPPVAADAYYAGWDASGAAFSGGYTIHHALGQDQQYVEWGGTDVLEQLPASTLSIAYDSTFWGVVNSLGSIGAGGSGSALLSPANQVVGTGSLAVLSSGKNTAGVCPIQPPPVPSPTTATALFTALSGVWTSTADRTSSTGSKTLKSILDPAATGQTTMTGISTQPIALTASTTAAATGSLITLSWNVAGAASCTASGGSSGDGWAGTRAASGSLQVTDVSGGLVIYALNCLVGSQLASGNVTVSWDYIAPYLVFTGGSAAPVTLGVTAGFNWQSNVEPCVASGGVSGDGWSGAKPSPGSFTFVVAQTGLVTYTLTCGSGTQTATSTLGVNGVGPAITLVSAETTITAGSRVDLNWFGYGVGAPCVASGGSSNDSWSTNNAGMTQNGSDSVTESDPGTYTFTITCTGGGQTASSSKTVVVNPNPPALSLTPASTTRQIYQPSGTNPVVFDLVWKTSVDNCFINYTTNSGGSKTAFLGGLGSSGVLTDPESVAGMVTYTMQCGLQTTSTTINWVTNAAPIALTITDTTWAAQIPYAITWKAQASPCAATGGSAGDGWTGSKGQSGSQQVSETQPGVYLFALTCGTGPSATTSQVIAVVPQPRIQMYSTPEGGTTPLTDIIWTSSVGPCTYVDGSVPNSAGVAVPPVGQQTPNPTVSGIYLFTLTCGSGTGIVRAATLVSITANVPTTLTASATSVTVDSPVTLTWNSIGSICYAIGGDGSAPWVGTLGGAGSGSLVVTSKYAGSIIYSINCNNELAQVTVVYTAVPPASPNVTTPGVTLSSSVATQSVGSATSLTWNSSNADTCVASGGSAGDGWTGILAISGSMTVTETSAGTVTYSITCAGAPPAATASTTVVIKSAAAPPAASSSSHGGGGLIDALFLLILGVPFGVSLSRAIRNRRYEPARKYHY
jgi:hypothetical protein